MRQTGLGNEPLESSDHNMIEFTLQFEREKLESDVMVLQLNKGNYKDMREELARVDWKGNLAGKTVEQQCQEFLGVIREAQQKFIPRRRKHAKGRTRHPWLTRKVKDSFKAKEKAYKVVRISGKPEDWEAFKSEQWTTKKAIRGRR